MVIKTFRCPLLLLDAWNGEAFINRYLYCRGVFLSFLIRLYNNTIWIINE